MGNALTVIKTLPWCSAVKDKTDELILQCPIERRAELNTVLVQNRIEVLEITPLKKSLEEYLTCPGPEQVGIGLR